jgi:hypothetical protein
VQARFKLADYGTQASRVSGEIIAATNPRLYF